MVSIPPFPVFASAPVGAGEMIPRLPSPPLSPTARVTIDPSGHPHILEAILASAPFDVLLAFRAASRRFRDAVDALLVHHVLIHPDGRLSPRRFPNDRLPSTLPPRERIPRNHRRLLYPGWAPPDDLPSSIRILDHNADAPPSRYLIDGSLAPAVARRWPGATSCGVDIRAPHGIVYLTNPGRLWAGTPVNLRGKGTRVLLLPLPRELGLVRWPGSVYVRGWCTEIVFRRCTHFAFEAMFFEANSAEHDIILAEMGFMTCISHILAEMKFVPPTRVVLVDFEGSGAGEKGMGRAEFVESLKKDLKNKGAKAELADSHLRFLSEEEYRAEVGEEAFALEEDNHEFRFG